MDAVAALADCRLVVCLPADAGLQTQWKARGVTAVGLGDPGQVAACQAAQVMAFAGSPAVLHHHRHKFDGAFVDLDAIGHACRADEAATLAAVEQAVHPGGRIVLRAGANTRQLRTPPREWPTYPGTVFGAYADLFVGCSRVLDVGIGDHAFADALRMRDLQVTTCDLTAVGLRGLTSAGTPEPDGISVGPWIADLDPTQAAALFATLRSLLPPHGRVIVRATPAALAERIRPALDPGHWATVRVATPPRDARHALMLLRPTDAVVAAHVHLDPRPLPAQARSLDAPLGSWFDLERSERRVTSQTGEDGVLAAIFAKAGTTNRYYVEFGCGDGVQCNTRQLFLQGWRGLLMDGAERPGAPDVVMHAHWIERDNINALFDHHGVPAEPDLLSIDLDGNDFWIWQAISRRPRVVVAEYNGNLAADRALTIPYDPTHRWDGSDFYGCSLLALVQLARTKGYTLVHCTTSGVNAFFIRDDLLGGEPPADPTALFRPANYWYSGGRSLPNLAKRMQDV